MDLSIWLVEQLLRDIASFKRNSKSYRSCQNGRCENPEMLIIECSISQSIPVMFANLLQNSQCDIYIYIHYGHRLN